MKNFAHLLAAAVLVTGCSTHAEANFRVSSKYPICISIPGTLSQRPTARPGYDFEVTEFEANDVKGNVYVGDFPDYPGFSPDKKVYDPAGQVTFLGAAMHRGYTKELFRFGLGSAPSIYVLTTFTGDSNMSAPSSRPIGALEQCTKGGT